jgi:GT2 family glycosyltransferase
MTSRWRLAAYLLLLLPVDLILALTLVASAPLWFRRRGETQTRLPDASRTTIIIVNWDGKHLLAESLPALLDAVKYDGGRHDILVVDNGSTDGSVEYVRSHFPCVRLLELDRNYGFSGGNHRGIESAATDTVVLLNNDMIVERGFLRPLLDGFTDPSVFAVTSQIFFADAARRREETGKTRARFERGFFYLWHDDIQPDDERQMAIPVVWAGGGSCAIDRRKYLAIGGFDALYRPFYVEDVDVSYQAWKRGWKCVLAPASRVVHKHRSTTQARFGLEFVENTIRKNQYLFIWKNVTDHSMLLEHLWNLPRIHARAMRSQAPVWEIKAYLRAFRQLPEAVRRRISSAPHYRASDSDVLARSQQCERTMSEAGAGNR